MERSEFCFLWNHWMTFEKKGSLRRHQLLSVLMVTEELSAQNDHLLRNALTLVVNVLLPAVEVISKDYDQEEAAEVLVAVLGFFVEVTEDISNRGLSRGPEHNNDPLTGVEIFSPQLRKWH